MVKSYYQGAFFKEAPLLAQGMVFAPGAQVPLIINFMSNGRSICILLSFKFQKGRIKPFMQFPSFPTCDSKFGDIFDEEFFIQALSKHVNIVRDLPDDVLQQYDNNISSIVNLRVKAWSSPTYYLHKVLPKLLQLRYVFLVLKQKFNLRRSFISFQISGGPRPV